MFDILARYGPWFYNYSAIEDDAYMQRLEALFHRLKNRQDKEAVYMGLCALRNRRNDSRGVVARECAAWFDTSAFAPDLCVHLQPKPCAQCEANARWNEAARRSA